MGKSIERRGEDVSCPVARRAGLRQDRGCMQAVASRAGQDAGASSRVFKWLLCMPGNLAAEWSSTAGYLSLT